MLILPTIDQHCIVWLSIFASSLIVHVVANIQMKYNVQTSSQSTYEPENAIVSTKIFSPRTNMFTILYEWI